MSIRAHHPRLDEAEQAGQLKNRATLPDVGAFIAASKAEIKSADYVVGKPTQKVTPRYMKETIRPDGSVSVVTGQTRAPNGKIGDPHSHSIVKNGQVQSSRTQGRRQVPATRPNIGRATGSSSGGRIGGVGVPSGDLRGSGGPGGVGGPGGGSGGPKQR